LTLVLVLVGCKDTSKPAQHDAQRPTDVAPVIDAYVPPDIACVDQSVYGQHCTREADYGAVVCTAAPGINGWCVPVGSDTLCMPGCEGVNYACCSGTQHYHEGNECYCAQ
jgi:hypothetical protein